MLEFLRTATLSTLGRASSARAGHNPRRRIRNKVESSGSRVTLAGVATRPRARTPSREVPLRLFLPYNLTPCKDELWRLGYSAPGFAIEALKVTCRKPTTKEALELRTIRKGARRHWLGAGHPRELRSPRGSDPASVETGRMELFCHVRRRNRRPFAQLRELCLPKYLRAAISIRGEQSEAPGMSLRPAEVLIRKSELEAVADVIATIGSWCERWHIVSSLRKNRDWPVMLALEVLEFWRQDDRARRALELPFSGTTSDITLPGLKVASTTLYWDPVFLGEKWAAFEARTRACGVGPLRNKLRHYRRTIEKLLGDALVVDSGPRRGNPNGSFLSDKTATSARERFRAQHRQQRLAQVIRHMDWLARFQVLGESRSAIAAAELDATNSDTKTTVVTAGLRRMARHIGLRLREADSPGRPRNNLSGYHRRNH